MFILCTILIMSFFSLGWKDNTSLCNSAFALNYIRCQVLEMPPKNPIGIGPWRPFGTPSLWSLRSSQGEQAQTIMYRVRIARFSQDDQKAPLCVTVPLLMIRKEVISRTQKKQAYIPPIRYHMKPKRTNSLCVSNSLFLFQLWAIFTARFSWAKTGWNELPIW